MPRLRYKSTGFSKLKKLLKALPDEATAGLKTAVRESAEAMAETARQMVPERTGKLRGSIEVAERKDGLSAAVGPGVTSKKKSRDVFYANFVEFGTKGSAEHGIPPMPARPFLLPAFFLNEKAAIKRVRESINDAVRAAIARAGPDTTD